MERIVLAYSGGLDTSVAIPWLKEKYNAEIIAVTMDLGQGRELEEVRDRALAAGATRAHVLDLREGAQGELLLTGLPGVRFPVRVSKVAPVASAEDGRNSFRVEAAVLSTSVRIQPGMEGVGKVYAGQHSLLWVWTHHFAGWLRFALWSLGL